LTHFVYILCSSRNGRYYTGSSADPAKRLADHNLGRVTATRHLRPWQVVYVEEHSDATTARKREYQIKSIKSRKYIEELIRSVR
jgi:putative endonuclease